MRALVPAFAAAYGAILGSFLNVCIFRLPRRCLRIWKPKLSFCPSCHRTIPWYENLPLVSFLALLGRCRGCKAKIPLRYFLVELATAAFFAFTAARYLVVEKPAEPAWGLALVQMLLFCALLVCALVDWDWMIIPDEIDIPGFLVAPLVCAAVPSLLPRTMHWFANERLDAFAASAFGAAIGASVIWTIRAGATRLAGREAMGFGDVKFLAMIGGFTGWQGALAALFGGSVVGSFYGLAQRARGGPSEIFFGPFLAIGGAGFAFSLGFQSWVLDMLDRMAIGFQLLFGLLPWTH